MELNLDGDSLPADVPCLPVERLHGTLISSAGFNCDVWRSASLVGRGEDTERVDVVIKRHRDPCPRLKVHAFRREYLLMKRALGDILPDSVYVATTVGGKDGVVVIAETCEPWFDLANASNEEDAVPLLERAPRARDQLARFVEHARYWARCQRVVDLYGVDNLVMDKQVRVRFIDSFDVFFYTDLMHSLNDVDPWFGQRVEIALRRLDYLERLVLASGGR